MRWRTMLLGMLGLMLVAATLSAQPTVTVAMRLAEAEWEGLRQLILPPFEAVCQCRVRALDVPPETLRQRLRAMPRAGRMEIDLFAQDNMRRQELVDAGLAAPFTPREAEMEAAIYPALRAVGVIRNARYFLPFRPNVQITYYNADKFVQYELQPPRTWPELLNVAWWQNSL